MHGEIVIVNKNVQAKVLLSPTDSPAYTQFVGVTKLPPDCTIEEWTASGVGVPKPRGTASPAGKSSPPRPESTGPNSPHESGRRPRLWATRSGSRTRETKSTSPLLWIRTGLSSHCMRWVSEWAIVPSVSPHSVCTCPVSLPNQYTVLDKTTLVWGEWQVAYLLLILWIIILL